MLYNCFPAPAGVKKLSIFTAFPHTDLCHFHDQHGWKTALRCTRDQLSGVVVVRERMLY